MNFGQLILTCTVFLCILSILNAKGVEKKSKKVNRRRRGKSLTKTSGPLMVFMLDGFRWDYYNRLKNHLPGFSRFLREGVQAEYVEPVFPVLSFPNWASLSTGVFPEIHGILGNYFLDLNSDPSGRDIFRLDDTPTTQKSKWWQNSEPIWITATKAKKRTFLRFWSRADVPFQGMLPEESSGYESVGGIQAINKTLIVGLNKLLSGFDLVMIYGEHIDNVGHRYGPDSYEIELALLKLDEVFKEFLETLDQHQELKSKLNIVIVSDHGMTETGQNSGTEYLFLEEYIDKRDVFRVLEGRSFFTITPMKGKLEFVYERLKRMPGVDVYKRKDIPEHLGYKNDPKVQDIILICRPGYAIHGLQSSKQIPRDPPNKTYFNGVHGYTPDMPDQRAIFFARGPAFKKNVIHSSIRTVDIYQVYTKLLGITPQPNNGTWANVAAMFA